MTILFAAPDMDAAQWRARLAALLPNHPFVLLGEPLAQLSQLEQAGGEVWVREGGKHESVQ